MAFPEEASTGTRPWGVTLDGTDVSYGPGVLANLGDVARGIGGERVLVITDPGIRAAGHVDRGVEALEAAGLSVRVDDGACENPSESAIAAMAERAREFRPDVLVGLGGGSSMDAAKGINFVLTNGGRMRDYHGYGKATLPMFPSIGIPTTAGTGSEGQSYALVSSDDGSVKMACGDRKARFRAVLLDPELTVTQPSAVAAATGIDALSHAVESYVTKTRNPVSTALAREAWRLLAGALPAVFRGSADVADRGRALVGAFLAGAAIEHSMLGAAHACANPLTARYGIVHGVAVGLMLPSVVRYNRAAVGRAYDDLESVIDAPVGEDASRLERRIEDLRTGAGLPARLRDAGVPQDDLDGLAAAAGAQWTASHNPRPVDAGELREIYEAAY